MSQFFLSHITAKMQYFDLLLVLIVIFQSLSSSLASFSFHYSLPPPPQIWLSEYILEDSYESVVNPNTLKFQHQFENDFFTKNGSNYVVFGTNVLEFAVTCEAQYPIKWVFPYPEQLIDTPGYGMVSQGYRAAEFSHDLITPLNKNFRIFLVFYARSTFLSVNFTCQSVEEPKVVSSIHVFLEGKQEMESVGKILQVEVPDANPNSVLLPCRPSLPDSKVLLQKQVRVNQTFAKWIPISQVTNQLASFDPKYGFTLTKRWTGLNPGLLGYYKCTLDNGDDDTHVFVNVTQGEQKKIEFEFKSNVKASASVNLTYDETYKISAFICCSGVPLKPPVVEFITCTTVTDCDLKKYAATARLKLSRVGRHSIYHHYSLSDPEDSSCVTSHLYHSSVGVFCVGDNVEYVEHYINIANKTDPKSQEYNQDESQNDTHTNVIPFEKLSQLKLHSLSKDQKIVIRLGKILGVRNKIRQNRKPENVQVAYFGSRDFSSRIFPNLLDYEDFRKRQRIEDYGDTNVYDGEAIVVMCFALTYFYSHGAWVQINWKNATETVLKADFQKRVVYYENRYLTFIRDQSQVSSVFSGEVVASTEMDSIDCFMPVWDSDQWDMQRNSLNIKPSFAPKFIGEDVEVVYFGLYETGHEISCELLEGTPLPLITISKDGKHETCLKLIDSLKLGVKNNKKVNLDDDQDPEEVKNSTDISKVRKLSFPSISHDMHGEYVCKAGNLKGEAVKIFKVIVTEKMSVFKIMLFIFVGILSISLTLLGLYHWRQQRKVQTILNTP